MITIDNRFDLQENILLKFGKCFTADYQYGYTFIFHNFNGIKIEERIPKYWKDKNGTLIKHEDVADLLNLTKPKQPLSSYEFVIIDFSNGKTNSSKRLL